MGYEPCEQTPQILRALACFPKVEGVLLGLPTKATFIPPPLLTQQASVSEEVVVPRREVYKTA